MEDNKIEEIVAIALSETQSSDNSDQLQEIRNRYLSKKSELMSLMSNLGELSIEKRKEFGQKLNAAKAKISEVINAKQEELKKRELAARLAKEEIDISLPSYQTLPGGKNPFHVIIDEMTDIFLGMGFEVEDGPEVEQDLYNFELLNIPHDHPARDMQDTFYISDSLLLRTHTSPVQAHAMEKAQGKPVRIICPGKTIEEMMMTQLTHINLDKLKVLSLIRTSILDI